MKSKPILIILLASLSVACVSTKSFKKFTPSFDLEFSENVFMPSEGNLFTGGEISSSVGLETKFTDNSRLYALYDFNYLGPAFHPQDTKNFNERSLSQVVSIEWQLKLSPRLKVKPGFTTNTTYRRFAVNETWDSGLYNMQSKGGHIAVDYTFDILGKESVLKTKVLYRDILFPNYSDLFEEFETASLSSEISGGAQDQKLYGVSLGVIRGKFTATAYLDLINFENQNVLEAGGVYGSDLQKDKNIAFDLQYRQKLNIFEFSPKIKLTMFRSNQNYLRFKYFAAPITDLSNPLGDVTFIDNNYSYDEISLDVPVSIKTGIDSKWGLNGRFFALQRKYKSRPARDSENNYTMDNQRNRIVQISAGVTRYLSEITSMSFTYTFTSSGSNNKFERYLPYNYTGNTFGATYNISF